MKLIKFLKLSFLIFFGLQMAFTLTLIVSPKLLNAQENPTPLQFTPQISIPGDNFSGTVNVGTYDEKTGRMNSDLLAKYVQAIYNYGMGIVGILAAIVLMAGGVLWLTSSGSADKIGQAKELIFGSIIGLVLLLGSWIILNTVNPDLLKLKTISLTVIKKINLVCCEYQDKDGNSAVGMLGDEDCTEKNGKVYKNTSDPTRPTDTGSSYYPDETTKKCVLPGCCVTVSKNSQHTFCYNTTEFQCRMSESKIGASYKPVVSRTFENTNCANVIVRGIQCGITDRCGSEEAVKLCRREDLANIYYGDDYCYSGLCWFTLGFKGEPCGNEGGFCMTKVNNDECPAGFNHDLNGRSCNSAYNLLCCKPN